MLISVHINSKEEGICIFTWLLERFKKNTKFESNKTGFFETMINYELGTRIFYTDLYIYFDIRKLDLYYIRSGRFMTPSTKEKSLSFEEFIKEYNLENIKKQPKYTFINFNLVEDL